MFGDAVIHLLQLPNRLVILFAYQELPALGNSMLSNLSGNACMSITLFLELSSSVFSFSILFFSWTGQTLIGFSRSLPRTCHISRLQGNAGRPARKDVVAFLATTVSIVLSIIVDSTSINIE